MQRLSDELGVGHEALRAFHGNLRFLQGLFAHPNKVVGAGEVLGSVLGSRIVVVIVVGGGAAREGRSAVLRQRSRVTQFDFHHSEQNERFEE